MLFAVFCGLWVVRCVRCVLSVVWRCSGCVVILYCALFGVCCLFSIACCLLAEVLLCVFVCMGVGVRCLLFVVCCSLRAVRCMQFAGCCSLIDVRWPLCVVCFIMFAMGCSLFLLVV